VKPKSISRICGPLPARGARPARSWLLPGVKVSAAGLLGLPLLFAVPEGVSGQVTSEPAVLPADGSCRVLYRGPERLRLPGNRVPYVDALRLDASESGELLLSGLYRNGFMLDDADVVIEGEEASFLGVLLDRSGTARPLPSPDPDRHLWLRWALPQEDGAWEILMVETDTRPETLMTPSIGLWHGVFKGESWRTFQSLPSAPELRVHDTDPLPVVVENGSVMWVENALDRSTGEPMVALLGGPERSWSFQTFNAAPPDVPPGAPPFGGFYPRLGWSEKEGLVLALIHPDWSGPRRGGNSLFLYRLGRKVGLPLDTPELLGKVACGSDGPTSGPVIAFADRETAIGWTRRLPPDSSFEVGRPRDEARALLDPFGNEPAALHLGSGVSGWRPPSVHVLPDGALLWAVHRWVPREDHAGDDLGRFVLRLLRQKGGEVRLLGELPSPFDFGRTATAMVGSELVVAGGIRVGSQGLVVSHIARYRVECKE
jgi:hypothetical protein